MSLIRCALAALGTRQSCCHRVPSTQGLRKCPAKAELASMLPGFRFLFAAIVLSMSMLVFGLGAAALLRAAHEEFASIPSWHAAPETVFARQNESTRPVLAMLNVEPLSAGPTASEAIPAAVAPTENPGAVAPAETPGPVASAEAAAIVSAPAVTEKTAALKPEDS